MPAAGLDHGGAGALGLLRVSTLRARPLATLVAAGVALFGAHALGACESRLSLGGRCAQTSDCGGGLTCSLGRCRSGCATHAACGASERCLGSADGVGVCTLTDDPACDATSCGAGRVCTIEGCFDLCDATCGLGGACVDGRCEPITGDAGVGDAAIDVDAATGAPGRETCALDVHCGADERCARVRVLGRPSCHRECLTDAECDQSAGTSRCVRMTDPDGGFVSVCSIPCDPLANVGCFDGDACDLMGLPNAEMSAAIGVLECRHLGTGTLGASCDGSQIGEECDAGLTCEIEGGVFVCVPSCGQDASGATSCPADRRCTPDLPTLRLGDVAYGACELVP